MTFGLLGARAVAAALALLPVSTSTPPHASLSRSEPVADSHLTVAPHRIALWFTERPQIPFSRITLVGPSGDVPLGKITADTGDAIRADIVGAMPEGTYKVVWHTAAADGHPASGEFSFMVGPAMDAHMHMAAMPSLPKAVVNEPPPSPGNRFVRLWEFIGLFIVLGVLVFVHAVLPPLAARGVHTADASQQARGLGEMGAVIYVLAAAFRLMREVAAVAGLGDASTVTLSVILRDSSWGHGWLFGVIGAALVIVGLWLSMRRATAGTPVALTGALAMIMSAGLTGHAASSKLFIPAITLDALHVASVGAWLGTLTVVVLIGIPAMARVTDGNADAAVSALVNSFHPIALLAAPLAVLAGIGSAVLRLGSFSALTSSRYGSVLMVKLIGVALVLAMGAWNSMRARRRLGTPQATKNIRRTATIELVLATLVLWATTDLIATALPTVLTP